MAHVPIQIYVRLDVLLFTRLGTFFQNVDKREACSYVTKFAVGISFFFLHLYLTHSFGRRSNNSVIFIGNTGAYRPHMTLQNKDIIVVLEHKVRPQ